MTKTPDGNQAIAALRDAYAAFNRGDMDAAVASVRREHRVDRNPRSFPAAARTRAGER